MLDTAYINAEVGSNRWQRGSQGGGSLGFGRGRRVKGCTMAMRLVIKPVARILVPISPAHLTLPASAAQHTHGFVVYMKPGSQNVQV